jgi:hypothetical protein
MVLKTSRQALRRAEALAAAATADFENGVYSRQRDHLREYNGLVGSLPASRRYEALWPIKPIPRHALDTAEHRLSQEREKLTEIVSKARTLRDTLCDATGSVEARKSGPKNLGIPTRRGPGFPEESQASQASTSRNPGTQPIAWDVFISHASEDKPYVEPLVEVLKAASINVWYDRLVLEWGDDLRKEIDQGLTNCRYGIVVFSKAFLAGKKWTDHELNGLFALERHGRKLVLPIWHGITQDELLKYSPAFANRLAKDSSRDSYEDIRDNLLRLLDRPVANHPATPAPQQPSQEGETVAFVIYYAPNGERPTMYVRKAAKRDDWFILHNVDGTIEEGGKPDIAIKYTMANKRLTMGGYKQQNVSGGSAHPEFNL